MVDRKLEAAAHANEVQASAALFFVFKLGALQSIDVGVSASCPCKLVSLSHKFALDIRLGELIKKCERKGEAAEQQWRT